ncbi:MAG: hypothetical protein ACREBV_08820, partial [Candidatus Zixiibacteriota bacterium]
MIINTSAGTPNWEIITSCASIEKVPIRIFLADALMPHKSQLASEFALDDSLTEFIEQVTKKIGGDARAIWKHRDETIVKSSDFLIPVSIRPGGSLFKLIQGAKQAGKEVIDEFHTKYEKSKTRLSYTLKQRDLSDGIKQLGRDFIFHWTRATNGPWPDEKKIEFYENLLNSEIYPRSAFDTLKRIIDSKKVIASARNMPDRILTVSFSGLSPLDAIKLMKWRSRYRQMSFEPYGLGLDKTTARSMGISQVQYYDAKSEKVLPTVPPWLLQSKGRKTDWSNEDEYRILGDFNLTEIPVDKLVAICRFRHEALELQNRIGINSYWYC